MPPIVRAWGCYEVIFEGENTKVKLLHINPGKATSLQRHAYREEHWFFPDGRSQWVPVGEWHQLSNPGDMPLTIVEVQLGHCDEADIERA